MGVRFCNLDKKGACSVNEAMELVNQNVRPYYSFLDANKDQELNLEDAPITSYDTDFFTDGRVNQSVIDKTSFLLNTTGIVTCNEDDGAAGNNNMFCKHAYNDMGAACVRLELKNLPSILNYKEVSAIFQLRVSGLPVDEPGHVCVDNRRRRIL